MFLSIGRIVQYTLSEQDVEQINRRRSHARNNKEIGQTGFVLNVGNDVETGDNYPLIITRVWEDSSVNGQVMLDGNDTLWVTSVKQGTGEQRFREFPRV